MYRTAGRPILSIIHDECGIQDRFYSPCNERLLEDYYNQLGNDCRGNISGVIHDEGIAEETVYDVFNVFMKSMFTDQMSVDFRGLPSGPGDTVRFEAEQDALAAVSACAVEGEVNACEPKPIVIRVPDGTDVQTTLR